MILPLITLMVRFELIVNVAMVRNDPPFRVSCPAVGDEGAVPSPASDEMMSEPALIVVLPVNVFVASSDVLPVPFLTTVPAPVAIGSSTVMLPSPSNTRLNEPEMALPVARSNTKMPASD